MHKIKRRILRRMTSFGRTKVKKTSKSIQVYRIRESPFSKGLQGYTRVSLAIKKIHLVENLAEGLNTEIGEKGTCLSGGEKQRLALARLWFEDSELVILDEATSAMDNLTEENVMKSVMQKMKDKTVIAIAHRLNSIAGFDRIILFKEGRIVGQGTFEELLHTDSYFMDLYNANVK